MKYLLVVVGGIFLAVSFSIEAAEVPVITLSVNFEDTTTDNSGIKPVEAENIRYVEGKTGKGIIVDKETVLSYPTKDLLTNKAGAIQFWFKPNWQPDEKQTRFILNDSESHLRLGKNEWGYIFFQMFRDDWKECLLLKVDISKWKQNEWHFIRIEWDLEEQSQLTVDSNTVKGWATLGESKFTLGTKMYIGSPPSKQASDKSANGIIDELQFIMFKEK